MAVQPKYHWQFNEGEGSVTTDHISGVNAKFVRCSFQLHGRIGHSVLVRGDSGAMYLGKEAGRFGTSDFTIAFGIQIRDTHGQTDMDIIGNRSVKGHGNWVSLRLLEKTELFFEVDENGNGKNYATAKTSRLAISDGNWHHVAIVREGPTLKIYFNGALVAEGASNTGVAGIDNGDDMKVGDWLRDTPTARYEDLRIYHTALSAEEVAELIPPVNRPLRAGEIELVATDGAAVILTQDTKDLTRFSAHFQKLRLGPHTGVTLYKNSGFAGTEQKLYADLPEIRHSRLRSFPGSLRVYSSVGEPFTGKSIITAPNGQFLSLGKAALTTSNQQDANELFRFHSDTQRAQVQLLPGFDRAGAALKVSPGAEPTLLFVDDSASGNNEFFITNEANNQWLKLNPDNTFSLTERQTERSLFVRIAKLADNEGQVGELAAGEVALYEHVAYWGRTWVLSDSGNELSGKFANFTRFQALNDRVSSIRLGPDTGATLYKHVIGQLNEARRETEIEDITGNVPTLLESQVGNDTISSIKIFRTVAPEDVLSAFSTRLSQDYRMVGDALEEFSAYRTILKFAPDAGAIEVSATDLTMIEVEGSTYEIDEVRSATLTPNALGRIMITSEADGVNTPGLKIRTNAMAASERVVIFPNREVHRQIADLEDGALWNATDAKGNLIVDRQAHSQADVASVQSTIKRVMATVSYADNAPAVEAVPMVRDRHVVNRSARSRVPSANRVVSSDALGDPWVLTFEAASDGNGSQPILGSAAGGARIREETISQDEFLRLLDQAAQQQATLEDNIILGGRFFSRIKDAVKKAVSVVIGVVKKGVQLLVQTAEGVIAFVIDTAEKVGEFIEAVVEKVVQGIKQFIEFLQFLFDWDDILETQRYLVSAVNASFDFAVQLAEDAKKPVSDFVDSLQESVEDGFNSLVRTLGVDPSEPRTSDVELPEAAEWFLAKLMGGSRESSATPVPTVVTNLNAGSPLGSFFSRFSVGAEKQAEILLRAFEGVRGTIEAIIANPRRPQQALAVMFETIRDVIIQALDLVEDMALSFLDVVKEAINLFQDLLNGEIKIPFISKLFEMIGGGKFTLLNLASLLLAIPVTVVSKLVFNQRPFQGVPVPDFSAPAAVRLAAPLLGDSPEEGQPEDEDAASGTERSRVSEVRSWGIVVLIADLVNGLITTGLDAFSEQEDDAHEKTGGFGFEVVSMLLSIFSWQANFIVSDIPSPTDPDKDDSEDARFERILHYYRGAILVVDSVFMALGVGSSPKEIQRMKRREKKITAFFWVLSVIDAGLAIRYLVALPNNEKPGFEIANETISWLPNLLCPLRLGGSKGAKVLAAVDLVAALVNTGLGGKLLADDLKDLREAERAAPQAV